MSEKHAQHSHLTMGGTHPKTMSKRSNTHIWSWEEHIQEPYRKGSSLIYDHGRNTYNNHIINARSTLTSDHGRNTSNNHVKKALHLHLTMEGTNPTTMSERLCTYIWPWEEHILQPCQKGSLIHHLPLEGTLIWRTPSFSLKYSNFTLAISSIESH